MTHKNLSTDDVIDLLSNNPRQLLVALVHKYGAVELSTEDFLDGFYVPSNKARSVLLSQIRPGLVRMAPEEGQLA